MLTILMELKLTSCEIVIVGTIKKANTNTHLQMVGLKSDEGVDEDVVAVEGGVSIFIVKKT